MDINRERLEQVINKLSNDDIINSPDVTNALNALVILLQHKINGTEYTITREMLVLNRALATQALKVRLPFPSFQTTRMLNYLRDYAPPGQWSQPPLEMTYDHSEILRQNQMDPGHFGKKLKSIQNKKRKSKKLRN